MGPIAILRELCRRFPSVSSLVSESGSTHNGNEVDVKRWYDRLVAGVDEPNDEVELFEYRKEKNGTQHEYLVFRLHSAVEETDTERGLRADRYTHRGDTISRYTNTQKRPSRDWILSSCTFSSPLPRLLDIAAVIYTVSSISDVYINITLMSYWFTHAISRTLIKTYPSTTCEETDAWREGHYRDIKVISEDGRFIWNGLREVVLNMRFGSEKRVHFPKEQVDSTIFAPATEMVIASKNPLQTIWTENPEMTRNFRERVVDTETPEEKKRGGEKETVKDGLLASFSHIPDLTLSVPGSLQNQRMSWQ